METNYCDLGDQRPEPDDLLSGTWHSHQEGKLTDEEYNHIKTHTVMLESILSPIPSVQDIFQAATSHHEHWDGSGYKKGLAGQGIPLFGRVIAVAHVYDALTSNRPYHRKISSSAAAEIIRQGSGSHFCPDIVKVFQELLSQ